MQRPGRLAASLVEGPPLCPSTLGRLRPPPLPGPPLTPAAPFPPSVPPEPGSAGPPSRWRVLEPRTRPALTQLEGNGIEARYSGFCSGPCCPPLSGFGACPPSWARGINPGAPGSLAGLRATGADPPACGVETLLAGRSLFAPGTH